MFKWICYNCGLENHETGPCKKCGLTTDAVAERLHEENAELRGLLQEVQNNVEGACISEDTDLFVRSMIALSGKIERIAGIQALTGEGG